MKTEAGYLITAAAVSGMVMLPLVVPALDAEDFLDVRVRMYAAGFGVLWTGYRAVLFGMAWLHWRSWRRPPSWSVKATELHIESCRGRLPRLLAMELHSYLRRTWAKRLYADKGILIGRGFRWGPEHTQELEDHLQGGQALPVGRDVRGGHPALHAVGQKKRAAAGFAVERTGGARADRRHDEERQDAAAGIDRVGSHPGAGNGHHHRSRRATRSCSFGRRRSATARDASLPSSARRMRSSRRVSTRSACARRRPNWLPGFRR